MKTISLEEAQDTAKELGIDFSEVKFTLEEYLEGMNIELEHGTIDSTTNVTDNALIPTGKIALAHLNESPLYYNAEIGLEAWEHAIKDFKGNPSGRKILIV